MWLRTILPPVRSQARGFFRTPSPLGRMRGLNRVPPKVGSSDLHPSHTYPLPVEKLDIYIYIRMYTHLQMYVRKHARAHIYIYTHIYIYMLCIYIHIYIYVHNVRLYVYQCVYVCVNICSSLQMHVFTVETPRLKSDTKAIAGR